jgi:hypothetical protein
MKVPPFHEAKRPFLRYAGLVFPRHAKLPFLHIPGCLFGPADLPSMRHAELPSMLHAELPSMCHAELPYSGGG